MFPGNLRARAANLQVNGIHLFRDLHQCLNQLQNTNISNSYCYHALLTGKEKHGCNTIKDLNSLSAILKSLDELQIYMSNLNVEKYRAKFYDLKATFLETENIPNKKAPNTN